MTANRNFLPLMIDLSGRKVMIFGGGSVGERKATLFSSYADTTVVSTDFTGQLERLGQSGKVKLVSSDVASRSDDEILDMVRNAFMVIPATDNASLNSRIIGIANKNAVLVNQVDAVGDVVVPSVIQRGDLTIGISTLGSSPAVSKYTRKKIEQTITHEYSGMIRLQDELRTYLKQNVPEQETRKKILWAILDDGSIWDALSQSYEKAYNLAYDIVLQQISSMNQ